jgi:acylphosphatase
MGSAASLTVGGDTERRGRRHGTMLAARRPGIAGTGRTPPSPKTSERTPVPADPVEADFALHLTVQGIVQGVGFRDGLRRQAGRLGLAGWVRNRRDGTVEALVRGEAGAAQALLRWAHRGPPNARVERVDVRPATEAEARTAPLQDGFRRLPTT